MYYHKSEKHSKYVYTLSEINDLLPKGEFIAVFGTSHTCGCCEKNNKQVTHICTEYTWPDIVSKALNVPYFNFAVPGNTNQVIVQQIIDFLSLPDIANRCKLILCEVRFGDIAGKYFFDLFSDDYHKDNIERQHFISGNLGRNHWLDEISGSFVPKPGREYVESLIRNSSPEFEDYVPTPAVDMLEKVIDSYIKSALTSSQLVVDDLLHVRTMRALATTANIPFRYFHWDKNKVSQNSKYFKKINDLMEDMYELSCSNISTLMPNVNLVAPMKMGENEWNNANCECGHRDHTVHKWVAEQIIEELKDDVCS